MLHGPLLGKIVMFSIPIAISAFLQQMFNAADTAVVGRFAGSEPLAAVGANAFIISLMVILFMGYGHRNKCCGCRLSWPARR